MARSRLRHHHLFPTSSTNISKQNQTTNKNIHIVLQKSSSTTITGPFLGNVCQDQLSQTFPPLYTPSASINSCIPHSLTTSNKYISTAMERNNNTTFWVASVLLLVAVQAAISVAQNCGCASGVCCSKFGYCGTGDAYCGEGCQSGPCTSSSGGGGVASIVTKSFFDGLLAGAASSCEGKQFYSYDAFIGAANAYSGFGTTGSTDVQKREIAAFFANSLHETGGLCYINEQNPSMTYCQSSAEWPCASGKSYHGRGPLQLSWNYNYGAAGNNVGFDGINNPEKVAQDATVSFKTAVWFWMNNCHSAITSGQGFGATIKAINSMECGGGNPGQVSSRVDYYNKLCSQLGVDPGSNVSC